MSLDSSFPLRVAMARNSLGFTQAELAKKVGVVARQIAAYEGGEARPRDKALHNLAAALGTTSDWLATGSGIGPDVKNVRKTVTVPLIPVYTIIQASSATEGIAASSASDFIACPEGAGENSFAFIVQGDSMTCDGPVSFPDGTIITIDPDVKPEHGDFGLFFLRDSTEATFKQLVIDQGKHYLKGLNPAWPILPCGYNIIAIGKALHAQTYINSNHVVTHHTPKEKSDIELRIERLEELMTKAIDAGILLVEQRNDKKP